MIGVNEQEVKTLIRGMRSVNLPVLFSTLPLAERRAVTRLGLPLRGTVTLNIQWQEVERKVQTKNISVGGGYFIGETRPPIGDQVKLLLKWPPQGKNPGLVLKATGKVLRIDPLFDKKWGFAVQFDVKRYKS